METAGPEAVPVHSEESPAGHSRVPNAAEVNKEKNALFPSRLSSVQMINQPLQTKLFAFVLTFSFLRPH